MVAFTVKTMPGGSPPIIQATNALPGVTYLVTRGTGEGRAELIRGGRIQATGSTINLVDPGCPFGVRAAYWVEDPTGRTLIGTTYRAAPTHVVTSLDGATRVGVRERAGRESVYSPRASVHDVAGSPAPVVRLDTTTGPARFTTTLLTSGQDTATLEGLVEANRPLRFFHNTAYCQAVDCGIPAHQVGYLLDVSRRDTGRAGTTVTAWTINVLQGPDPDQAAAVPVTTWGQFDSAAYTWEALAAFTWEEVPALASQ